MYCHGFQIGWFYNLVCCVEPTLGCFNISNTSRMLRFVPAPIHIMRYPRVNPWTRPPCLYNPEAECYRADFLRCFFYKSNAEGILGYYTMTSGTVKRHRLAHKSRSDFEVNYKIHINRCNSDGYEFWILFLCVNNRQRNVFGSL